MKTFSVLVFAVIVIAIKAIPHSLWQETGTEQNSDEERFYMDETNWEIADTQLATRHTHESSTEQQYENVTVRVGRRAVLPCFVGSEMDAATKAINY